MAKARPTAQYARKSGGCDKRVFLTYKRAEQWAKKARRAQKTPITVYRCASCRSWHVGHTYWGTQDDAAPVGWKGK